MSEKIFTNQVASFYPVFTDNRKLVPTFFFNYKNLPAVNQRLSFATTLAALNKNGDYSFTFFIYQDEFDSEHQITGKTFNVSPSKYTINPQNKLNDEYITLSLTLISDDFDIPEGTHTYFVTAALTDNNKSPQKAIVDTARTWFATRKI